MKFIVGTLALSLSMFVLIPVYAQNTSAPATERPSVQTERENTPNNNTPIDPESRAVERATFQEEVQQRFGTLRTHIKERRENRQARVPQEVQQRIELSLDQTISQFENAIQQLLSIANRLELRLTIMQERGVDVAQGFQALEDARADITRSTEAIDGIASSIEEALSSDTPKQVRMVLQTSLKEARASLREARANLLQAVQTSRLKDETIDEQNNGAE